MSTKVHMGLNRLDGFQLIQEEEPWAHYKTSHLVLDPECGKLELVWESRTAPYGSEYYAILREGKLSGWLVLTVSGGYTTAKVEDWAPGVVEEALAKILGTTPLSEA